jgi:rubrerythrin
MKVIKSVHKGKDVLICKGCGTVVQSLHSTSYFPEGYTYDVCPFCKETLDYNDPIEIVNKP